MCGSQGQAQGTETLCLFRSYTVIFSIISWYMIQIQEGRRYKRAPRGLNLGRVLVLAFLIQPPGPSAPSGVGEEIMVWKGMGGSSGRDRNFIPEHICRAAGCPRHPGCRQHCAQCPATT